MPPQLRFAPRFLALAALAFTAAFFVAPLWRNAVLAVAIAALVLAPLPRDSRGIVFAVMVGLATGIASVNLFAVSIFQGPVTREFGWSQRSYALVLTIGTIVTVLSSVAIGHLFDRHGVRRFAIISIVLFALALMSLYFLTGNLWHFYAVFALVPIIGAGTSSIAYSRVIARWFDKRRGQAFGAALAGIGIGGAVISSLTQFLINEVGWRSAYVGLGALSLVVTLPIVLWLLHDTPDARGLAVDGEAAPQTTQVTDPGRALIGFTASQTLQQRRFWLMLAAFVALAFAIGGVMLQLVPILRARGITANEAAATQGALGLSLIVGRAFAGMLMDRLFAPHVAAAILLCPIVGVGLLASGATGTSAQLGAVLLGLAAGAELDVVAYLITRYFGTRAYATIYGWMYAGWTLGSGTAPYFTALAFDRSGSHGAILWLYVALFAISALMIARLGRYPDLARPAPLAATH